MRKINFDSKLTSNSTIPFIFSVVSEKKNVKWNKLIWNFNCKRQQFVSIHKLSIKLTF